MKDKYLVVILVLLSMVSLFVGVHELNISNLLNGDTMQLEIIYLSRIPRLISIILSAVGMSISGVIMQQISNNKFVSPTTAATVDSAKLGVLISVMFFSTTTLTEKMIMAFIFSIIGTFIFMKVLRKIKYKNAVFIPLVGIMIGNVISSITDFIAYKYNLVQNVNSFMQGNFSMIIKGNYELLFLTIPLLTVAYIYAYKFTVIGMGEDISKNLGLNFNKVVTIGMVIVALISSLVVITIGNIPFLGLVVPNIVSIYKGDNLSENISTTALVGAIFVLCCDVVGRLIIFPYEIPISVTVGSVGSIIFLWLIFRRNNNEK
ncbi:MULTISPECIES: ABC transporter permease [Clostridium]|uniref:ABC transporter permease n=1 Tax=Clostridium senegalense TaxID=1465809 RepID=A0A6M0H5A8_9CLOT|nr:MULTISPECIES: ABC transporter permease [Clostridium]NEU05051.1 ABC transporter permease [Clostridium senegalense]